jgi:hypothetical protein
MSGVKAFPVWQGRALARGSVGRCRGCAVPVDIPLVKDAGRCGLILKLAEQALHLAGSMHKPLDTARLFSGALLR